MVFDRAIHHYGLMYDIMQKFLPSLLTYRLAHQCQATDELQNVMKTLR